MRNKIKFELSIFLGKLVRLFHRPPLPVNPDGSINLHLGCGNIEYPGFINIDGIPAPHVHYVQAIDKLSQFSDRTVDLIYACHCLEHFSHKNLTNILSEWNRVLKSGGILRLSVPDFNRLLVVYNDNSNDINSIIEPLMGGQEYRFNFHYSVFTRASLTSHLTQSGFTSIQDWQPDSSELTKVYDWSNRSYQFAGKDYPVSLNLEAVK